MGPKRRTKFLSSSAPPPEASANPSQWTTLPLGLFELRPAWNTKLRWLPGDVSRTGRRAPDLVDHILVSSASSEAYRNFVSNIRQGGEGTNRPPGQTAVRNYEPPPKFCCPRPSPGPQRWAARLQL